MQDSSSYVVFTVLAGKAKPHHTPGVLGWATGLFEGFRGVYLVSVSESKSEKVTYPPVFGVVESEKAPPESRRRDFKGEIGLLTGILGLLQGFWGCTAGGVESRILGQKIENSGIDLTRPKITWGVVLAKI